MTGICKELSVPAEVERLPVRNILITNDDGIASDGLIRLSRTALEFGQVWVVAPDSQRSAMSQSITLRQPIRVWPAAFPVPGIRAYASDGTPADCVRLGCLNLLPEKPDLVLAGINYGYNAASDIQYSATLGAAFEALYQGCRAIAFSEQACPVHEVSDAWLRPVLEELLSSPQLPDRVLNVNFPGCALKDCKGVLRDRKASRGAFYRDRYRLIRTEENGSMTFLVDGIYNEDADEGTDFRALVDGYISIGTVSNVR